MRPEAFELEVRLSTPLVDDVPVARRLRGVTPSAEPVVSVVVPAYNEARRILPMLLSRLAHFEAHGLSHEIIIVDDGSRDATAEIIREVARRSRSVRLISLPHNLGKGAAVRTGVRNATGRLILIDDADGATPISEFTALHAALERGADIAIGSRALKTEHTHVSRRLRRWAMGRVFASLVNVWAVPDIADTQCGFKLLRADAAQRVFALQQLDGFAFDVEVLCIARQLALRVTEVPINWADVDGSKVSLVRDSLCMLWDVLRVPHLVQKALHDAEASGQRPTSPEPRVAAAPLAESRQEVG